MKVLVTAIGGEISQSVIKCLKNSKYRPYLVGCDCNPYAGGRGDVDMFFQAPLVSQIQEYKNFLKDIILTQQVQYVFPVSYQEIQFFHTYRGEFQENPASFVAQNAELVETFLDKFKTGLFFESIGFPFPQTWLSEEYQNQLDFPLVLKKRWGSGGRDFFVIQDSEELRFLLTRKENMIIQEYLPGEDNEFTAGLFSDGRTKQTITFKRQLAPGGFSQQVELVEDERIISFPQKLAETLDFCGSLNVQFRLTEKGCIPFEVNPRFSSTVYFRHLFGFKDVEWSLDLCEGQSIVYSGPFRKGVGVRTFGEIILDEKEENSSC